MSVLGRSASCAPRPVCLGGLPALQHRGLRLRVSWCGVHHARSCRDFRGRRRLCLGARALHPRLDLRRARADRATARVHVALDLRLSRPKSCRHGRAPAGRGVLRVDAGGALRPTLRSVQLGRRVLGRLRTQFTRRMCEFDRSATVSSFDGLWNRRMPRHRRHGGHPRPSCRRLWALCPA